jgi:hypothetical protein
MRTQLTFPVPNLVKPRPKRQLSGILSNFVSVKAFSLLLLTQLFTDNNKRYGTATSHVQKTHHHHRSLSMTHSLEGLQPGPEISGIIRPAGTPNVVEADVFPPLRAQAPDPSIFLPYITEDIAFEEEYEEYLSDLGWSDEPTHDHPLFGGHSAWHRLQVPEFGHDISDGISDSESIVPIGELGDDARLDIGRDDRDIPNENMNNWEVRI